MKTSGVSHETTDGEDEVDVPCRAAEAPPFAELPSRPSIIRRDGLASEKRFGAEPKRNRANSP